MAARLKKGAWRFYVYSIGEIDNPVYIGKGSGRRLKVQESSFGEQGQEVARFYSEDDAYFFERQVIAELSPKLNKCPGGNGSRATPVKSYRKTAFERELERVGSRRYCARFLLNKYRAFKYLESKVDYPEDVVEAFNRINVNRLMAVANGPRC